MCATVEGWGNFPKVSDFEEGRTRMTLSQRHEVLRPYTCVLKALGEEDKQRNLPTAVVNQRIRGVAYGTNERRN